MADNAHDLLEDLVTSHPSFNWDHYRAWQITNPDGGPIEYFRHLEDMGMIGSSGVWREE